MTSGPTHFTAAESLLASGRGIAADDLEPAQLLTAVIAEAQVHATLALASATALRIEYPEYTRGEDSGWAAVAGLAPSAAADPARVWWLDDGQENPGEPLLYTRQGLAFAAGVTRYREDNPQSRDALCVWTVFEENGPDALELVAAGKCTGIIVRPIRPKAGL